MEEMRNYSESKTKKLQFKPIKSKVKDRKKLSGNKVHYEFSYKTNTK